MKDAFYNYCVEVVILVASAGVGCHTVKHKTIRPMYEAGYSIEQAAEAIINNTQDVRRVA